MSEGSDSEVVEGGESEFSRTHLSEDSLYSVESRHGSASRCNQLQFGFFYESVRLNLPKLIRVLYGG